MLPSILAHEIRESTRRFLVTAYEPSDAFFGGVMQRFVEGLDGVGKGPYLQAGLPFRMGVEGANFFGGFTLPNPGYSHQEFAWRRLASDRDAANTLVATGTGSGKTECFLYPLLDHCVRMHAAGQVKGIKALVIYPMNALAGDQARRFADVIASTPAFKGLRVGLYVGGAKGKPGSGAVMTATTVITDRDSLRKAPPDILLTNYKMLDYLLIRPRDRPLWAHNSETTLRYAVVDELHTFDGAQGTDLAMLLRRLRARLNIPDGHLICALTVCLAVSIDLQKNYRHLRIYMALTIKAIEAAKPTDKSRKLGDSGGLYLLINPKGSRWWRLDYRFGGKRKTLSMGTYPDTGLANARELRDAARKLLAKSTDPGAQRKAIKLAGSGRAANSLEVLAREWLAVKRGEWTTGQYEKELGRLEKHAFTRIGQLPIAEIGVAEIRPLLTFLVNEGHIEQAHRLRNQLSRVFRFAVATERASRDPPQDLRDTLPARQPQNYATITDPLKVGELLRVIDGFTGTFVVSCALKLAPQWFCRPGEIRQAEWSQFDLDGEHPVYRVPPEIRKLRKAAKESPNTPPHLIPLSTQSISILRELHQLTGRGRYLFPSTRSDKRTMSDGTVNAALHRMGYKGVITGHGFRHMARTLLGKLGWEPEILERQLSHKETGVSGVYNKAQHLPKRRLIMQEWANYLDTLKATGCFV